jgi:hypothetical protein
MKHKEGLNKWWPFVWGRCVIVLSLTKSKLDLQQNFCSRWNYFLSHIRNWRSQAFHVIYGMKLNTNTEMGWALFYHARRIILKMSHVFSELSQRSYPWALNHMPRIPCKCENFSKRVPTYRPKFCMKYTISPMISLCLNQHSLDCHSEAFKF